MCVKAPQSILCVSARVWVRAWERPTSSSLCVLQSCEFYFSSPPPFPPPQKQLLRNKIVNKSYLIFVLTMNIVSQQTLTNRLEDRGGRLQVGPWASGRQQGSGRWYAMTLSGVFAIPWWAWLKVRLFAVPLLVPCSRERKGQLQTAFWCHRGGCFHQAGASCNTLTPLRSTAWY